MTSFLQYSIQYVHAALRSVEITIINSTPVSMSQIAAQSANSATEFIRSGSTGNIYAESGSGAVEGYVTYTFNNDPSMWMTFNFASNSISTHCFADSSANLPYTVNVNAGDCSGVNANTKFTVTE